MNDKREQPPVQFSGLWLPLITPFRNNVVDHTALARLVRHYGMGLSGYNLARTLTWAKAISGYPVAGLLVPAPRR